MTGIVVHQIPLEAADRERFRAFRTLIEIEERDKHRLHHDVAARLLVDEAEPQVRTAADLDVHLGELAVDAVPIRVRWCVRAGHCHDEINEHSVDFSDFTKPDLFCPRLRLSCRI